MAIKSFELEPTRENLLSTLTRDLLERNQSVWHFARFCDEQDGKCSIAIDAKWGQGKHFCPACTVASGIVQRVFLFINQGRAHGDKTSLEKLVSLIDEGENLAENAVCPDGLIGVPVVPRIDFESWMGEVNIFNER